MAPRSSTFAWKIPWTEEPGRLQSMGSLELDTTEQLHFHFSLSCIGEGNGNPLQCSCLGNPRDSGAWWAAVYGVARSQTRLKRLSSSSIDKVESFKPFFVIKDCWNRNLIFVSGKEFHGWRSLVGYSPWGHKESDTTERLHDEGVAYLC